MSNQTNTGLAELRVSAPGKLILFGEHSVVYGKTAVAASLGLRSTLSLKEIPEDFCEIDMPAVGLSNVRLGVEQLREKLLTAEECDSEKDLHSKLLDRAREYVNAHKSELNDRQKRSLECLLYALARVCRAEGLHQISRGFRLELTTDLTLGAGLGSSASFSVCLAAGFLVYARLRQRRSTKLDLKEVSSHAFACEKIMHGAPSGVDNEVCTFGRVIEFRKGEQPKQVSMQGAGLRVLLVDTKVARSTKTLVDRLAGLRVRFPEVYESVFEAIDRLCRRVVKVVEGPYGEEECRQLSALIDINQGLLTTCQVSHPSIDSICATAKRHGLSAKLTGAGGGGFVYVLVPPNVSAIELQGLITDLTAADFFVTETSLGGEGLTVHDAGVV